MVLYFSDNKETEHKKKGVFYEETLPENAVIFGSTTLKKYSGGPADYMKIGTKRYYIDEPVNERDVIGYIPVVAERHPSVPSETIDPTENKYGYIQVKEGYSFLPCILSILLLLILLVLIVRSVGGSGIFKNNVVLPDKHEQPSVSIENKETIKEPDKNQDTIQPTAPTKESENEEKNTPVAVLPIDPVIVPGNKPAAKPVSIITPTATPSPEPASTTSKPTATSDDSITPAPTATPHVHTYVVEEQVATCTEDGYYRTTCSGCGEVLADHVYKKLGHNMQMIDSEDNTSDIMTLRFKCNRCDYTESTIHTHNWIAKGYENMTYPDGGDAIYVCSTCLNKKTEHRDAVPGMYDEAGTLMYTYNELEKLFQWDLSVHYAKYYSDNNTELSSGKILKLPTWEYLTKKAEASRNDAILMNGGFHNSATCAFNESTFTNIIFPEDMPYLDVSWFGHLGNLQVLEIPDSVKEYTCSNGNSLVTENLKYLKFSANADINHNTRFSFGNKDLETIIFPEGIKTIDNDDGTPIFYGTKIKEIQFPSTLSKLNCKILCNAPVEELTIPAGVELNSTSEDVIYFLDKLKKITLMNVKGDFSDSTCLIHHCPLLETLVIQGDYGIGDNFVGPGCDNLKTIVFSGNISYINENAFAGCALEDIYYIGNDEASKQVIANAANGPFGNATIHYMNEEATTQSITSEVPVAAEGVSLPAVVSLPVTEETISTNTSESTDNTEETKSLKSVSDGDAN